MTPEQKMQWVDKVQYWTQQIDYYALQSNVKEVFKCLDQLNSLKTEFKNNTIPIISQEEINLIENDQYILAIKTIKDKFYLGLGEAKKVIDDYCAKQYRNLKRK